ncbi:MAG TPA: DUF4058 domain-containing protein [Gemmataceae bacterium]|nr:DUF4058 domain-containing protein [Gemmataceae bacterium]
MPMHDWTRVEPTIFHDFRHSWLSEIKRAINRVLPTNFYALIQQQRLQLDPNLTTQQRRLDLDRIPESAIVVCHDRDDRTLAIVEIVSPAIKYSADAVGSFAARICEGLRKKLQILLIDPFPQREQDKSVHCAIWQRFAHAPAAFSMEKPLLAATYSCRDSIEGYVHPFAVGDEWPDMPLFLEPEAYIDVPLERTYMAAWEAVPLRWRKVIEPGTGI